jgi:hypothetical protein
MGTRKRRSVPACLERVQRRFEHWRQTRKIPSRIDFGCEKITTD